MSHHTVTTKLLIAPRTSIAPNIIEKGVQKKYRNNVMQLFPIIISDLLHFQDMHIIQSQI